MLEGNNAYYCSECELHRYEIVTLVTRLLIVERILQKTRIVDRADFFAVRFVSSWQRTETRSNELCWRLFQARWFCTWNGKRKKIWLFACLFDCTGLLWVTSTPRLLTAEIFLVCSLSFFCFVSSACGVRVCVPIPLFWLAYFSYIYFALSLLSIQLFFQPWHHA